MEAANRGARDVGALSVDCRIEPADEQRTNDCSSRYARAFVIGPGGFGTLDELFEALMLTQTRTIREFPAILLGEGEWDGLLEWLRDRVLADRRIDPEDLAGLQRVADPEDVVRIVTAARECQRAQARRQRSGP